jgi:hypothetical protein
MGLMNVLCPYRGSFFIVYFDDILVYSATWEEDISHLIHVLETLKNHQLLANLKKCEFAQHSLVYFRYAISGGDLTINPKNMEAIMKGPIHTNFIEVRILVGETEYLQKFIASFCNSSFTTPRHNNK